MVKNNTHLGEFWYQKYAGDDNYGKPKWHYLKKLSSMTNEELLGECRQMIWLSSYAANNIRSDYHWMCDACYDECDTRKAVDTIYRRAYKIVERELGYD